MNKLLIFLFSLLAVSLEAAIITNWGAQLPTAAPVGTDIILMQKGGVTYYFTPNQLAANIATNSIGGITNKIGNLNGVGTNPTFYSALNLAASAIPTTSNSVDAGTYLLPLRTNWVNDVVAKSTITALGAVFHTDSNYPAILAKPSVRNWFLAGAGSISSITNLINNDNVVAGPGSMTNGPGGPYNTGFGSLVLEQNATGQENSAYGAVALRRNTTGSINAAFASDCLASNTTGIGNSGFGWAGGMYNTVGSYGSYFGWGAGPNTNNLTNASAFGAAAVVGTSDTLVFGGTGGNAVRVLAGSISKDNYGGHFDIRYPFQSRAANTPAQLFVSDNALSQTANTGGAIDFGGHHVTDAPYAGHSYTWARIEGVADANTGAGGHMNFLVDNTAYGIVEKMRLTSLGLLGIGTAAPLDTLHVVGGIVQTNGGIWQTWSLGAPSAPATQGAVYWNDGTNICAVFRNAGGALSTNKLTMSAWP